MLISLSFHLLTTKTFVSYKVKKRPLTELCAPLVICFQIANSRTRWRCSFQWLSQDGGRADFPENLRESLFNKELSNEHTFIQIHLDGQHRTVPSPKRDNRHPYPYPAELIPNIA